MATLQLLAECTLQDMDHTLSRERGKFIKPRKSYKIIACGGDHSVGGMGRKARTYNIPLDKVNDVDTYIDMCEHFSTYASMAVLCEGYGVKNEAANKVVMQHLETADLMSDIFQDKWDYRTEWCWMEFPNVERVQ
jgi:hypothetical protein